MNLSSKPISQRLAPRGILKLRGRTGERVDCLDGSVWITQEGDPRDVVLGAGQSFTLDRAGTAIVEALVDGALVGRRVAPPARPRSADRPLSFAVLAFGATAACLFLTVWLPAGGWQQAQARAPQASSATVAPAHAGQAWPEPAIHGAAVVLAEPVPTF